MKKVINDIMVVRGGYDIWPTYRTGWDIAT
jgi:hypothetical protein